MLTKYKRILLFTALFLLVLFASWHLFARQWLVNTAIAKFAAKTGAEIELMDARLQFGGVLTFKQLQIRKGDQINLSLEQGKIKIKFFPLLRGKIDLKDFYFHDGKAIINLQKSTKDSLDTAPDTTLVADQQERFSIPKPETLSKLFELVPDQISFEHFQAQVFWKEDSIEMSLDSLKYIDHHLHGSIALFTSFGPESHWTFDGRKEPNEWQLEINGPQPQKLILDKEGYYLGFQHVSVSLNQIQLKENFGASFKIQLDSLQIWHPQVVYKPIDFGNLGMGGGAQIAGEKLIIDKGYFQVESFEMPFEMSLALDKGQEHFQIHIHKESFPANDFFSAIPRGLFLNFEGIEVEGDASFSFELSLPFRQLDSLHLEADLTAKNLKILRWPQHPAKYRGGIDHNIYEGDQFVKQVSLDTLHPKFVRLAHISPYLIYSVLTAEDGGFMGHKGFHPTAFRDAMVANLKAGYFARGGSTVSMQLVKNLYLNRSKTISRKVEEMLIVWMIENMRLLSKERMLEIYFNIIEWGPGIYGVQDACRFYFDKHPSEITLSEALYMSALVPRPKQYVWFYENETAIKPYFEGYFRNVAGHMLRRGQLDSATWEGITLEIPLQGSAKERLEKRFIKPDSLEIELIDLELEDLQLDLEIQ